MLCIGILRPGCSVSAYLTFITSFSLILLKYFSLEGGICTLNPVVNDYNQPGIKRLLCGYDNHILMIFINLKTSIQFWDPHLNKI